MDCLTPILHEMTADAPSAIPGRCRECLEALLRHQSHGADDEGDVGRRSAVPLPRS